MQRRPLIKVVVLERHVPVAAKHLEEVAADQRSNRDERLQEQRPLAPELVDDVEVVAALDTAERVHNVRVSGCREQRLDTIRVEEIIVIERQEPVGYRRCRKPVPRPLRPQPVRVHQHQMLHRDRLRFHALPAFR